MGTISLQIPTIGQPDTTEDVKIANNFTTIASAINGGLDATNLTAAVSQSAGVNASGQTVKGSTIISTSQSTSSATLTTLATPDQVSGIVLGSNGLILVYYRALWSSTAINGGQASICLNGTAVQVDSGAAAPAAQQALSNTTANTRNGLVSFPGGLFSQSTAANVAGSDPTTGMLIADSTTLGGAAVISAAAGTYSVSVQFKASSGTVTVDGRRLYVRAVSFA